MDLNQLKSFVTVAYHRNLTQAAERLHLSQPAVSAQIKAIENHVGTALFHRNSSGMTLTRAGEILLPEAEALPDIDEVREAVNTIRAQSLRVREITRKLLMVGHGLDPRVGALDVAAEVGQVLRLLAGGQRNRDIADSLFVSETTVKAHLRSINVKLIERDRRRAEVLAAQLERALVLRGDGTDEALRQIWLTIRLGGVQFTKLIPALKLALLRRHDADGEPGDVSHYQALATALAATVGVGNIAGVATAIHLGGPGALFWMWVSAILGMATKYAEGVLAIKYRSIDENGEVAGGPMYYIEQGMGMKWKWLAKMFAFFGAITALMGCGTFPQVNAITESVSNAFNVPIPLVGAVVTIATAAVVIGGIKSISSVAEYIVPLMAAFYVAASAYVLFNQSAALPGAFALVVKSAFEPTAVAGGATGAVIVSVMTAMRTGIARGVYTNEAGLGSAPIVVAAAKSDSGVRQGLIAMTGVFFTTIVICTMTGLVIITSGLLETSTLDGGILSNANHHQVCTHGKILLPAPHRSAGVIGSFAIRHEKYQGLPVPFFTPRNGASDLRGNLIHQMLQGSTNGGA